ncbi:MAG: enoyl-CoA hydratase/isomerase family protein [Granulosicoccus sp.]|nr:enoyl-CoA hydratase/isomerase family protein [Granulosicoccus sp.]
MSEDSLILSIDPPSATFTLNRPDKLNAITDSMLDALHGHCRRLENRRDIRAVIITGSGERAFSAGGDVAAWSALPPDEFARHWVRNGHVALDALAQLSQPVIAVLNGHVLGGGLELAATADIRIAESHIRIGQPETTLGIIPGWSGTQRATRRFGAQMVRRMALFGEMLDAEQALRYGIVDYVVERGEGGQKAQALVQQLTERSPLATELTKQLINAAEHEDASRAIEALAGQVAASSEDLKRGLHAFRQKKKADFGTPDTDS